ncbi:hypothetical protein D9758_008728 [Tetrapyrgos nigripes]|uniref:Uncharacterized protein n=1 Tax=Tetrapyrgos nigripes TaxID=182062 RepID=A0A8H5FX82_9AGAR|nr:hypothetical protein D9758_008728 [Tetrapyrgos nigripes]
MVVNKKQSLSQAPGMGSRTNSAQVLNRTKPTTNAKNVPTPMAGPSTTKKSTKAVKKAGKAKKKSGSSWMDRLIVLVLTLFSAYALWTCPSDERLVNPVCRSLSQYRTHVLEPYVLPPINNALSHPSIAPVVSKVHAAERAVTPVVLRAHALAQPYISKSAKFTQSVANRVYKTVIRPQYEKFVLPQYRAYIGPHVQRFQDTVLIPYVTPVMVNIHVYANRSFVYLHQVYTTVQPHVRWAYSRAQPHVQRAWKTSRPYLVRAAETAQTLLAVLMEKLGQLRRLYVDPHVLRIWDKVVELSGPVRSNSVPVAGETKASSVAPTKSPRFSQAATTSSTFTSSATQEAEPETVAAVPEETLSVAEPEETAEAKIAPAAEESVSKEVEESATEAAVSPTVSNANAAETESASSVVAETISAAAPAEPLPSAQESLLEEVDEDAAEGTAEEPFADEDELQSFLDDLGILPDVDEPESKPEPELSIVDVGVEDEVPTNQTPEEALASQIAAATERDRKAREDRKDETAKKRADLEDRHRRWAYGLDELIHRRMRELRKELVRVRKGAVKALAKQGDHDEEKEQTELEEQLTHINGEPVGSLLGSVESEGEKLLRGLEGYLKKEQKDSEGTKPVPGADDRLRKWMSVSEKVRSKFSEKVMEMQGKVHNWYRGVKDLEVQECLSAAKEIKSYAEGAQADLGLDYAWLDDVTYYDWQKYHDLMRAFQNFEDEVRLVQNGSHAHPPIDPLIPALDTLQVELEDVKGGFDARVRALGVTIREVLFGPDEEETPSVQPVDEPIEGEEKVVIMPIDAASSASTLPEDPDKVSILPVDPAPSSPSEDSDNQDVKDVPEFDASQVILSKGNEQVEEALKGISIEPKTQVHEEL